MSDKTVKVGVIGAGGISQVAHIPNLRLQPDVEIAAICDSHPGRAASVAERYGIPRWYDEPERMTEREELNCVVIATPTITHLPFCQLALENSLDVLVEKPIARNVEETRKILSVAENNSRILMVGMNHRFRQDTARLKALINTGGLGETLMVRSGWLKPLGFWGRPNWFTNPTISGGGVLMDLGLQLVDVVLYILNYPTPVDCICTTSNKVLGLEVEDTASAMVRFDDGASFLLEVSWANCEKEDVAYTFFAGSKGVASLNPLRATQRRGDSVVEMKLAVERDEVKLYKNSFSEEISHFIKCVRQRSESASSGIEALSVIDLIDRLYKSAGY